MAGVRIHFTERKTHTNPQGSPASMREEMPKSPWLNPVRTGKGTAGAGAEQPIIYSRRLGQDDMVLLKLIDKIPFFSTFDKENKLLLAESGSFFATYEKGEVIIRENEIDDALLVIIRGSVVVTKNNRPDHVLTTLRDGAVFGEISFLTKRPRSTNVVAEERTICFIINGTTMNEMGPSLQIQFRDQLIDILIRRLDTMNSVLPTMLG